VLKEGRADLTLENRLLKKYDRGRRGTRYHASDKTDRRFTAGMIGIAAADRKFSPLCGPQGVVNGCCLPGRSVAAWKDSYEFQAT
jgi:hypothetical protein